MELRKTKLHRVRFQREIMKREILRIRNARFQLEWRNDHYPRPSPITVHGAYNPVQTAVQLYVCTAMHPSRERTVIAYKL